jgi:tetratricopeptide (TPR) repeat protein
MLQYKQSMRQLCALALSLFGMTLATAWAASTTGPQLLTPYQVLQSKEIELAKAGIERVSDLVKAGALPRVRLEEAEEKLADAQDDLILARTLYGELPVQNLSEQMADDMVEAAQRRVERQITKLQKAQALVDQGITAKTSLEPVQEELNLRRMNLNLAHSRARLIGELAAIARFEQSLQAVQQAIRIDPYTDYSFKSMVRYDGSGIFNASKDLKVLEAAFVRKFERALPISAEGQTAVHEALGFDHRGRIDVAINPNEPEGIWLRRYLEIKRIPYYAFLRAIPGKATGAHIHIGPGSIRLHNAD